MKIRKKSATVAAFALGTCLFVSSALADMALGSGYDQLKHAIKHTTGQMEQGLDSYTLESLLTLKLDEQIVIRETHRQKYDVSVRAEESTNVSQDETGKVTSFYRYSDDERTIWNNGTNEKYYLTEFGEDRPIEGPLFTDPFKERGAPEMEKIADALVGNLKDYVQVEEQADGGRVYSGSLSEAQVPALVNAVASYAVNEVANDRNRMEGKLPEIESDLFVTKISGTAMENKEGLLENLEGNFVLTGKDKNGVEHKLDLSFVMKLSDINSTKVSMPDLSDKQVEVSKPHGFSDKYIGTYRNNIIVEKDGQFVKIGERTLEITGVDNDKVTGTFRETVQPGFESEYPDANSFTFEFALNQGLFPYTNAKGETKYGQLHPDRQGKIYLEIGIEKSEEGHVSHLALPNYDNQFNRVFEE